ncbi:MAG: biliverdin-producing heme oxygenase [Myxococcales bacterium]|nr:biliverdin-producing heme oxygenase [Myxococcales bacterium]
MTADRPTLDLAARLREATAAAHRDAEAAPFVQRLLRGELDRRGYARMLAALLPIYAALEAGLEQRRADPRLAWIDLAALGRGPAIARDLACVADGEPPAPAPAALDYAAHLRRLAAEAPALLVAHAYTRYLGDLAGGQALRRAAARAYDLSEGAGLELYAFADAAGLRRAFRAGLTAMPVDERTAAAIADEACAAFARHAALFAELDAA